MLSLRLDTLLTVLMLATSLMAVQLVILTFELVRLRRDVLRSIAFLAAAQSGGGWRGPRVDFGEIEDEPTEPRMSRYFMPVSAAAGRWQRFRAWLRRVRALLRWLAESMRG